MNHSPERKFVKAVVAVVTWNSAADIADCLAPLANLSGDWEVWVADNDSADATVEIIKARFPFVHLIETGANLGFAAAHNLIIEKTSSDYILLLNPDALPEISVLEKCLAKMESEPETGVLGIRLTDEAGNLQENVFCFPRLSNKFVENFQLYRFCSKQWLENNLANAFFDHESEKEVEWLMGAFLFVRREAINQAGNLPEEYFMFTEDMDWCWRIRQAHWKIKFTPEFSMIHKLGQSAEQLPSAWRVEKTVLGRYFFCLKNYGAFKTRLMQISDWLGLSYSILRRGRRVKDAPEIAEWKLYRQFVKESLFDDEATIQRKLNRRGERVLDTVSGE